MASTKAHVFGQIEFVEGETIRGCQVQEIGRCVVFVMSGSLYRAPVDPLRGMAISIRLCESLHRLTAEQLRPRTTTTAGERGATHRRLG